jgi:multiple sugar transport system ATP-binding protein
MAQVVLSGIDKVYDNGFQAVTNLSLEIGDGEFVVLVGPSGCGKSTALRMIAGLETITGGELSIDGRVVNDVPSKDRDIAMVFQSYALYPHMTVRENIGFALKLRKTPKDELNRRVDEAAEILELTEWLDRKPGQLSGGQRQRVAMGRAIVRQPKAFLMDEPLSNLDAKLRVAMRAEISRLQRRLGVTTVYVTHDQIEAMTMGDRVAVMSRGALMQVGTPQGLYDHPDNLFVAAFIGSPQMNLLDGTVVGDSDTLALQVGSQRLNIAASLLSTRPRLREYIGKPIVVGIRPEDAKDASLEGVHGETLRGEVTIREGLGSEVVIHVKTDIVMHSAGVDRAEVADDALFVARLDPRTTTKVGDVASLAVDTGRLHLFDPTTGNAIWD